MFQMSSKRKTSKTWSHFSLTECKKKATCKHCYCILSYSNASMSNLARHVRTKHPEVDAADKCESPLEIYTVEEVESEGLKSYEITMKDFDDVKDEIVEAAHGVWTPQTSEEWKVQTHPAEVKEKKDRKRSAVWEHFDKKTGMCVHCNKTIRLGTVSNLARHLRLRHPTMPFTQRNSSLSVKQEDSVKYNQDFPLFGGDEGGEINLQVVEINVDDIQNPISIIETKTVESTDYDVNSEFMNLETTNGNVTQSSQTEFLEDSDDFNMYDYIRPTKTYVNVKQVDQQLVKMIVKGCHPLDMVDEPDFQTFVKLLNPKYVIPSVNKLVLELIPECYREVERRSNKSLQDAEGVCLYMDQWRSKACLYVCVIAHFVNSECKFESIFLSCHVVAPDESAHNLSERWFETVTDWGIADKIVAVSTDNTEILLNAVQLCKWYHIPHFLYTFSNILMSCLMSIKSILLKATALIQELTKSPETVAELYARQEALHLKPVKLIKKVNSDWSSSFSTLEMLTRLVKLKTAIFQLQPDPDRTKMTENEWKILMGIVEFLGVFKTIKKELSKEKRVVISKVIFYIRAIKRSITKLQNSPFSPAEVIYAATTVQTGLEEQFKDLSNMDLVSNFLLLDPRLKKHVFEDESESALASSILKKEVCNILLPEQSQKESDSDPFSVWHFFDSEVKKLNSVKDPIGKGILELEKYLQEQLLHRNEDPFIWWKERCAIYPRLYKIARKYLCVTANSTYRESLSYKSAYMLTQLKRCSLSTSESEVMFLHHNM